MELSTRDFLKEIDLQVSLLATEGSSTEEEQSKIQELIEEVEVVQNSIMDYEEGKTKTIELPEGSNSELTTELSVADLITVSYKKYKSQETSLLDKAYEYLRGLVNSIISYLRKALVKHHAENSTYTKEIKALNKELPDETYDFSTAVSDFIFRELFTFVDTGSLFFETNIIDYIQSSQVDTEIASFVKTYNNKQSVLRPPQKVIEGTMSDETGTPRHDMIKLWHKSTNELYIGLANATPVSRALHEKTDKLRDRGDLNERVDYSLPVVPVSSDGINISYLYLTEEKDLLLGKVSVNPKTLEVYLLKVLETYSSE